MTIAPPAFETEQPLAVEAIDRAEALVDGDEIIDQSIQDIVQSDIDVAQEMSLEPGAAEVTAESDNLFAFKAKTALENGESIAADAIADVGTAVILEAEGIRKGNILETFVNDEPANEEALTMFAADLTANHAVVHAPAGTIDAGAALEQALAKMPHHPQMQESGSAVEYLERTEQPKPIEEEFAGLSEKLHDRIETAVQSSEFEATPEIAGAIEGYYKDHTKMASVLERVITGEQVSPAIFESADLKLESFQMNEQLKKLVTEAESGTSRKDILVSISNLLRTSLFRESAVGQTTISEQEVQRALALGDMLNETAQKEDIYIGNAAVTASEVRRNIDVSTQQFWDDSRHAGQLLFHNTPFIDDVAKEGSVLRTRANQDEVSGGHRAVTLDRDWHSQSIHFSEHFMTDSYKSVMGGTKTEHITLGGTVALPIAEVVKTLPFARMGEYGTVTVKNSTSLDRVATPDNNVIDWHNAGEYTDDKQGEAGYDRVFAPDAHDVKKAANYEIDFGQGMSSENGNTSHIILLQHDIDQAHRQQFNKDGGNVDVRTAYGSGYGYPLVDVLGYDSAKGDVAQDRFDMKAGVPFVKEALQGYAADAFGTIDPRVQRVATAEGSYREGVTHADQMAELTQDIARIEAESINLPQYKDKLVVMLRGGVMSFKPIN